MKRIPLVSILFVLTALGVNLIACAPATTAVPSPTPSPIPTSTQTATLAPTATATATQISPTAIIHESLATCPGFESLCTNPHAFGLTGAELTKWQELRAKLDGIYDKAWGQLVTEVRSDSKFTTEYKQFFNQQEVPTGEWKNLTNQQKMDMVAAYLRVYGDGVTAVNIPTSWMREAASSRDLLFVRYDVPDNEIVQIGYSAAGREKSSTTWYDAAPKFLSFGKLVTLAFNSRLQSLGIFGNDYVNPVNYPGKPITDVGLAWIYVRDQQGGLHATFVMFPFARQTLENGGAYVHAPQDGGGANVISPGVSWEDTAPVVLKLPSSAGLEEFPITPEMSARVWKMLAFARGEPGLYWLFVNNNKYHAFIGGLDVDPKIILFLPKGYVLPQHP